MISIEELFYKQKGKCYYCHCPMELGGTGLMAATRDHKIPRSTGGKSFVKKGTGYRRKKVNNIVAACQKCNAAKGSMSENEFRQVLKRGWK